MIEELNKIEEHLRMASIHLGQANEIFDVLMDFITGESDDRLELRIY
jgi:hypothetical protein